ncbi:MAG: hypothetical protein ABI407_01805 [Bradyrhizobium sp.]
MLDRCESARDKSIDLGRSFLASIVRWRDNFVGVAFSSERPHGLPVSDLEERLRQSEHKKRQLQRRINALLSQD